MADESFVKLPLIECHWTLPMISIHTDVWVNREVSTYLDGPLLQMSYEMLKMLDWCRFEVDFEGVCFQWALLDKL